MAIIIFFFDPFFFLSPNYKLTLKICVGGFSGTLKARINFVNTWTMSCCIVGWRIELLALILPFICPFFCLLRLNLCHSFLRNCAS